MGPSWWDCLGRSRKYSLIGSGVLEWTLRFQKPIPFLLAHFLFSECRSGCKFSVTALEPWLPACGHTPWHDGHGLSLWSCKLNKLFLWLVASATVSHYGKGKATKKEIYATRWCRLIAVKSFSEWCSACTSQKRGLCASSRKHFLIVFYKRQKSCVGWDSPWAEGLGLFWTS